jgi:hypothetical protein
MVTLRTLPLSSLTPAPYNPRKVLSPKSPAYRKLKASLEAFGLVEPLVWNERTGRVVGGHARLRILKELGYEEVPVSVVDLTDEREMALNVVLNNLDAQGRYDPKLLKDLLDPLRDTPEFDLTGFDRTVFDVLTFEPDPLPEATDEPAGRVEVTIATDTGTYERMRPRLDEVVREFDAVTHVRVT